MNRVNSREEEEEYKDALRKGREAKHVEELEEANDILYCRHISDKIKATIVYHVLNHGVSMGEAGWAGQPNVERTAMSSIIQMFHRQV